MFQELHINRCKAKLVDTPGGHISSTKNNCNEVHSMERSKTCLYHELKVHGGFVFNSRLKTESLVWSMKVETFVLITRANSI